MAHAFAAATWPGVCLAAAAFFAARVAARFALESFWASGLSLFLFAAMMFSPEVLLRFEVLLRLAADALFEFAGVVAGLFALNEYRGLALCHQPSGFFGAFGGLNVGLRSPRPDKVAIRRWEPWPG